MGLFEQAGTQEGIERAATRIKNLGKTDLMDWLEVAIPGMGRHLEMYRRSGDNAHLAEVALANMVVTMVVSELLEKEGIS